MASTKHTSDQPCAKPRVHTFRPCEQERRRLMAGLICALRDLHRMKQSISFISFLVRAETTQEQNGDTEKSYLAIARSLYRGINNMIERVEAEDKYHRMSHKKKAKLLLEAYVEMYDEQFVMSGEDNPNWVSPDVDLDQEARFSDRTYNREKYKLDIEEIYFLYNGFVDDLTEITLLFDNPNPHVASNTKSQKHVITLRKYFELRVNRSLGIKSKHPLACCVDPITQKTLSSSDLLDAILTVYTIKKAQNMHPGARDVLYNIYEKMAIRVGNIFIEQNKVFEERGMKEDVLTQSKLELIALLTGDQPHDLLRYILHGEPNQSPLLTDNWGHLLYGIMTQILPAVVREFAVDVCYCIYDLFMGTKDNERASLELDHRARFFFEALLRPAYWLTSCEIDAKSRIYRINSDRFDPARGIHLAAWLFGRRRREVEGALYRRLRLHFKPLLSELQREVDPDKVPEPGAVDPEFEQMAVYQLVYASYKHLPEDHIRVIEGRCERKTYQQIHDELGRPSVRHMKRIWANYRRAYVLNQELRR